MKQYRWQRADALYPDRNGKSYRMKRLRYNLRTLWHKSLITKFEEKINQKEWLVQSLALRPNFCYPLVHRFLDKRFSAKQRLNAMLENYTFLPQSLWENPISFGEVIPEFELRLMLNPQQPMEGFWALELYHLTTSRPVYLLTFAKLDEALLIAVIQGANYDDAKEIVKHLTKKGHGLRPAYLMVEAMKLLAEQLGFKQLIGIPQKYQNKSRLVQSSRYVVDYDQIFRESGGELQDYWQLSTQVEQRNLEEIASNKRSMYRKRYAMLDSLRQKMQEQLQAIK